MELITPFRVILVKQSFLPPTHLWQNCGVLLFTHITQIGVLNQAVKSVPYPSRRSKKTKQRSSSPSSIMASAPSTCGRCVTDPRSGMATENYLCLGLVICWLNDLRYGIKLNYITEVHSDSGKTRAVWPKRFDGCRLFQLARPQIPQIYGSSWVCLFE